MAVRSRVLAYKPLGESADTNGRVYVYVCPAGKTALVKHLALCNAHSAARTIHVEVTIPGGFIMGKVEQYDLLAAGACIPPAPRYYVLGPGMGLVVRSVGWAAGQQTTQYHVTGVELDGVNEHPF